MPHHLPFDTPFSAHRPKKRFGQNFLHDPHMIAKIIACINPHANDLMVEIGPGLGALTGPLLEKTQRLVAIELDSTLADRLKIPIGANSYQGLQVINTDALTVNFAALAGGRGRLRIVGNLPYNISTPLLFHLLEFSDCIADMHFMLQKEVVERLAAKPGSKAYGRLSVMVQYHCVCDDLLTVPPAAFYPPPKVTSAVCRLIPHRQKPYGVSDERWFFILVRECFNQRRKTLRAIFKHHPLLPALSDEWFASIGIDAMARPETLSVADFAALSHASCPAAQATFCQAALPNTLPKALAGDQSLTND